MASSEVCAGPFCDEDHEHVYSLYPSTDLIEGTPDDWEGPPQPEYSEWDAEAYGEMVRDDMAGRF